MALFQVAKARFSALKDKVVVISGGATGIGAATVNLLAQHGANVVFGDTNIKASEALVSSYHTTEGARVSFEKCNVTRYSDICALFKAAYAKYGRVDHAVSCAGIFEQGSWFDPQLTIDNVGEHPGDSSVLDVNVLGTAYFSRVAVVFMRHELTGGENKSLTLLSSVNAFRESPGLALYQTSKHAIQGLMRASRKPLLERDHIRINCVCPGVTDTPMTANVIDTFKSNGLFWQTPESVAEIILGIQSEPDMNGKAFYVEGGDGFEFEDTFYSTQPQWLGEEPTRRMRVNAEAVNKGALLKK